MASTIKFPYDFTKSSNVYRVSVYRVDLRSYMQIFAAQNEQKGSLEKISTFKLHYFESLKIIGVALIKIPELIPNIVVLCSLVLFMYIYMSRYIYMYSICMYHFCRNFE